MKVSPVSFKSLLCFTINDNKPKGALPTMIKTAFAYNPQLKNYKLDPNIQHYDKEIDATVHNAHDKVCKSLDKKYANLLPKGSNKVILTEVDVYVNPRDVEKRYYLTAATAEDERKILYSSFAESKDFLVAKFGEKDV